jgi:hypothetical protein
MQEQEATEGVLPGAAASNEELLALLKEVLLHCIHICNNFI